MKKILMISFLAAVAFAGCKKKFSTISKEVTVSYPTITFTGSQYISIPVGGTVPNASATAYDSTLHETETVLDSGSVDVTTPGLYVRTAYAKNSNGYYASVSVYVAVTNISASVDMSGPYQRQSNKVIVNVTKLATGLFMTDNIGGVAPPSAFVIPGIFVVVDDTTMILPNQNSPQGPIGTSNNTLNLNVPITYSYVVQNANFGLAQRVFVHQ